MQKKNPQQNVAVLSVLQNIWISQIGERFGKAELLNQRQL